LAEPCQTLTAAAALVDEHGVAVVHRQGQAVLVEPLKSKLQPPETERL
jgi:hypothetical protein